MSPTPQGSIADADDKVRHWSGSSDGKAPMLDMRTMKAVKTMKDVLQVVPSHPIPEMQGAFAESMMESRIEESDNSASRGPIEDHPRPAMQEGLAELIESRIEESDSSASQGPIEDAETRRRILIDQPVTQETHAARWKLKPGQQYHKLWKLMAQISFGTYLLLNGIAKDDDQVMSILQGHINKVDEFLEITIEDFDLALCDINERSKLLKLPLERIEVFDAMLQDQAFRQQIVKGNEMIEHVITRTATEMNDVLKDIKQGISACREFTEYLLEEHDKEWRDERLQIQKVFDAMLGNIDGWYKTHVSLRA